jgi:hypothetical protein
MDPITPMSVYRDHYKPGSPDPKGDKKQRPHRYKPITLGWIYRSNVSLSGEVSYSEIKPETIIDRDPDCIATIKDNQVFLNDILIATAPAGKTKSQKEKFCKAIVWSLLNDPISLQDKLSEIFVESMPPANLIIPDPLPVPMYQTIPFKVRSILPVFPAGYLPWLNVTIQEVPA